jgi:hypothetical protein
MVAAARGRDHLDLAGAAQVATLAAAAAAAASAATEAVAAAAEAPEPPSRADDGKTSKKSLPDHIDWLVRYKTIVDSLPAEAHPPPVDHGEHSYTCPIALGPRGTICRIEVLVRSEGFRVAKPKLTKEEKPFCPWGLDPHQAWQAAKDKVLMKLNQ